MKPRIAAAVGLLTLLLGIVAYLVLFHDPQYASSGPGEPSIGAATETEVQTDPVKVILPADDGREKLSVAETGGVETVQLDPLFERSLAGFKGRIVDHEKQPAPQKLIRFYRTDPSAVIHNPGLFHLAEDAPHAIPKLEIKEARTDEGGRFLVTGTWPGTFYVYEADADGEQVTRRLVQRAPGPGEVVDLGDIVLQLHGVIIGRVENEDGDPVAGALVRAADLAAQVPVATMAAVPLERFDIDGALIVRENPAPLVIEFPAWARTYYDMVPIPKTRTNTEGEFRLTGVMPGMNVVVVNAKGLLPHVMPMVKVRSGKEKDVKTIRLKEGEYVQGQVVDEEGKPVVGAEVLLANKSLGIPADFAGHHGPTDAEGRFAGSGFRPGAVTAAARTRPGEPWVVVGPTSATSNLVIRLPSQHSLTVRLKSSVARPIERVTFKLLPSHGYNDAVDIATMGLLRWINVDKRIRRLKDGRYCIGQLRKGRYDLAVQVEGHGVGRLKFELNGNLEKEIRLCAQAPFAVVVTDSAGKGVQNALVYARALRDWQQRSELLHGMPLLCGRTDRHGRLLVDCIQQGKVRLTATHPAYGNVHKEFTTPDATEVKVAFKTPGSITGLLTENGGQPTPGKWTIVAVRRRGDSNGAMPDLPKVQVPGIEGEFQITGLTPGEYRVMVVKSLDAVTSPGGMFGYIQRQIMGGDQPPYVETSIASGTTAHVLVDAIKAPEIITGPKARIQGMILLNGRPGAGMVIRGWSGRRFMITADAAGRFDLGERKAGNWTHFDVLKPEDVNIFSGRRSRSLYTFSRRVKDGENLDLNIVIETGAAAGTVFGTNGYAANGVRVRATGVIPPREKDGNPTSISQSANTDAKGHFSFETLPAGKYTFEVRDKEGCGAVHVDVAAGLNTSGLAIKLVEVYQVSGHVDMAFFGGEQPNWIWVQLDRQEAGASPLSASVNKQDGTFRLSNVPSGRYAVRIYAPGKTGRGAPLDADPIDVLDQDIKDLVLQPRAKALPKPEPKNKGKKK